MRRPSIRACISNYWSNHGTLYVVLGGDDTLVPVRGTKVSVDTEVESAMPTDLYYSGLDGNWNANGNGVYGETADSADMAWEVIVGRIPVQTAAQASNYVAKLIAFETAPPTNIARKIMLGGMVAWDTYTGTSRPSDDVTADGHLGFRDAGHASVSDSEMWDRRLLSRRHPSLLAGHHHRHLLRHADVVGHLRRRRLSGKRDERAQAVQRRLVAPVLLGPRRRDGWGLESGAFYSSDATALTNKTPFIYTDACLTGHFDGSTDPCLSEAFLRNPTGGALLYVGCSRYGWGEPDATPASNTSDGGPSTVYGYKFYKRLYQSNDVTCGRAFAMHKADMISQCAANGSERWIQFGLNLQGDPAILPNPATQSAQSPPFLPAIGSKATATSNALSFAVAATPTDGDAITNLWATGLPSGATFVPATATPRFSSAPPTPPTQPRSAPTRGPSPFPAAATQLKVRVRYDEKAGAGNTADYYYIDSVKLTATTSGGPLGSPPILAPIGNKSVLISNTLSFAVSVSPTDGDAVTNLWAVGLPSGATLRPRREQNQRHVHLDQRHAGRFLFRHLLDGRQGRHRLRNDFHHRYSRVLWRGFPEVPGLRRHHQRHLELHFRPRCWRYCGLYQSLQVRFEIPAAFRFRRPECRSVCDLRQHQPCGPEQRAALGGFCCQ